MGPQSGFFSRTLGGDKGGPPTPTQPGAEPQVQVRRLRAFSKKNRFAPKTGNTGQYPLGECIKSDGFGSCSLKLKRWVIHPHPPLFDPSPLIGFLACGTRWANFSKRKGLKNPPKTSVSNLPDTKSHDQPKYAKLTTCR